MTRNDLKAIENELSAIKLASATFADKENGKLEEGAEERWWTKDYRLNIAHECEALGYEQDSNDELLFGKYFDGDFYQFCFGNPSETFDKCEVMAVYCNGETI